MVVIPLPGCTSLPFSFTIAKNSFKSTVSYTHRPYSVTDHSPSFALNQATPFSLLPKHKQTLKFTHTCGSLHLHLFSWSSYTWMAGSTHSIVNLVLSTCCATGKHHLSLFLKIPSKEMIQKTKSVFTNRAPYTNSSTVLPSSEPNFTCLNCQHPLLLQQGCKALFVS